MPIHVSINSDLRKLKAIVAIYFAEIFAYRGAAIIWVIGDLQLTLFMPLVWQAAGGLATFSNSQMVTYYLLSMVLSQIVTCHLLWDIGFDIREGTFSTTLLKPISILKYCFARNIAWRFGKMIIFFPILLAFLPLYGFQSLSPLNLNWQFWIALVMGQTVAFFFAFAVAMVALWTTEFVSLFEIYYMPEIFLSGRLVPLSVLPPWANQLAGFTHFRYTVSFPVEVAMGRLTNTEIDQGLMIQAGWLVVGVILCKILLKRGLKQYSGFGN